MTKPSLFTQLVAANIEDPGFHGPFGDHFQQGASVTIGKSRWADQDEAVASTCDLDPGPDPFFDPQPPCNDDWY